MFSNMKTRLMQGAVMITEMNTDLSTGLNASQYCIWRGVAGSMEPGLKTGLKTENSFV